MDAQNYVASDPNGNGFVVVIGGSPSGTFGSQAEAEAQYNARMGNAATSPAPAPSASGGTPASTAPTLSTAGGSGMTTLQTLLAGIAQQTAAANAAGQQGVASQQAAAAQQFAQLQAQLAAQQATNSRAQALLGYTPSPDKTRADRALAAIFQARPEIMNMDINHPRAAGAGGANGVDPEAWANVLPGEISALAHGAGLNTPTGPSTRPQGGNATTEANYLSFAGNQPFYIGYDQVQQALYDRLGHIPNETELKAGYNPATGLSSNLARDRFPAIVNMYSKLTGMPLYSMDPSTAGGQQWNESLDAGAPAGIQINPATLGAPGGGAAGNPYDPTDWHAAVQQWLDEQRTSKNPNADLVAANYDPTAFAEKEGYIAPAPPGNINDLVDQVVLDKLRTQNLMSPALEAQVNAKLAAARAAEAAGTSAAALAPADVANNYMLDPTTGQYIANPTSMATLPKGTTINPLSVDEFRQKFETDTGTGTGPLPPIPSTQLFTQGFNAADRTGLQSLFKGMGIDSNVLGDQIQRLAPPSGGSSLATQLFKPQLQAQSF